MYKLLLARCIKENEQFIVIQYSQPSEYYSYLINTYPEPEMKKWAKPQIFNQLEDWPKDVIFTLTTARSSNITGEFMKANINTPIKVMYKSATPTRILNEIRKDSYTHVGLSVFINSYPTFIECAKAIRREFPEIKLIAGNVGAMFQETENYVDYVCKERGVPFLRNLFNEDPNAPYTAGISPDTLYFVYRDSSMTSNSAEFVTKIGCPLKCDFCITSKYFNGQFTKELITPQEAHDILVNHRKKIGNKDFTIFWAEPTAIVSHQWFYELFDLFQDEPGDYSILMPTTAKSLKNFDLERILNSSLRISIANIGIESFTKEYQKNKNLELKEILQKLKKYGIGTYATYIIGFPEESKEDIWNGIDQLLELKAMWNTINNLKILPETPLWNQLKAEGKLLDLPPVYYYLNGFHSFEHEHLKPGFEDMYPLLYKIQRYIETENGNLATNYCVLMKILMELSDDRKRRNFFKRYMKLYQAISKAVFPEWKKFFKPTERQIRNYLTKIDANE